MAFNRLWTSVGPELSITPPMDTNPPGSGAGGPPGAGSGGPPANGGGGNGKGRGSWTGRGKGGGWSGGGGGAGGIARVDRVLGTTNGVFNPTYTLPEFEPGDVIVFGHIGDTSPNTPTGWTDLGSQSDLSNRFPKFSHIWFRQMQEGDATTIQIVQGSNGRTCAFGQSVRGVSGAVEAASAGNNTLTPTPPNLAPSWGEKECLWLAPIFWHQGNITVSSFPTDYLNAIEWGLNFGHNGSRDGAIADLILAAASEQPGTYSLNQGGAPNDDVGWSAWTIAVEAA